MILLSLERKPFCRNHRDMDLTRSDSLCSNRSRYANPWLHDTTVLWQEPLRFSFVLLFVLILLLECVFNDGAFDQIILGGKKMHIPFSKFVKNWQNLGLSSGIRNWTPESQVGSLWSLRIKIARMSKSKVTLSCLSVFISMIFSMIIIFWEMTPSRTPSRSLLRVCAYTRANTSLCNQLALVHHEDGGDTILRNVGSYKSHTASSPRRW
jgi:hypothetical protein